MFFDLTKQPQRNKAVIRQLPPVPQTGWKTPAYFPNLVGNVKVISLDTETKELDFDHGPGWARNQGHIVGFSLAVITHQNERAKWYFPVRHEIETEYNMNPEHAFAWLKTVLETPNVPKVGANLIYDVGWLTEENIDVQGQLFDVQFAEALLQEAGQVNLNFLSQKYLDENKESNVMYQWSYEAYGGKVADQRENIYRIPPRLAGPYGEADADLPLRIIEQQMPLIEKEGLGEVFRMENDGIPLNIAMRKNGVRVDLEGAEKLHAKMTVDVAKGNDELYKMTGWQGNAWTPADCVKYFDAIGLKYNFTEGGRPSFTAPFLKTVDHPLAAKIREIREQEKIRGTFLESYLLNNNVNGRIHCQFHPLRGDSNGTRTGRDSSSNPNLQNIPTRSDLGKEVRKLFIPDEGHMCWEKDDLSQIEYRLLSHFAVGEGAEEVRSQYNNDPKTDYHNFVQALVLKITGIEIERKPIKGVNFGLLYGMGIPSLALLINESVERAKEISKAYHAGAPYVKATMDAASKEAEQLGYVTTILGRRRRFDTWEPMEVNWKNRAQALPYHHATRMYGSRIMRAETHKAINSKLQGSAGDQFKKAMLKSWNDGVFKVIGMPLVKVHDEADFSVIDDNKEQKEGYAHFRHNMETAIKLKVPVLCTAERAANWGLID